MEPTDDRLRLLMVRAGDRHPALEKGLDPSVADRTETDDQPTRDGPGYLADAGGDPNDIGAQGWGVVAPEGPGGDRLLGAIAPLMAARREASGWAEDMVVRVPPGLDHAAALAWYRTHFVGPPQQELPEFVAVLGDIDAVSLQVQQVLAARRTAGRIAFDDESAYAAYADKVLRWERAGRAERAPVLFQAVRDGTAETESGYRALVRPGLRQVRDGLESGTYPAAALQVLGEEGGPDPDGFLSAAAAAEGGVLFSLSHGEGAPADGWTSPEAQRRTQGAMSYGAAGELTGDDLTDARFLPGGVWFMLACYGAGTPQQSAYYHWMSALQQAGAVDSDVGALLAGLPDGGQRPFVAALPKAVLASEHGPVAFVGHIDLAWSYSYLEHTGRRFARRPDRLFKVVRALLEGKRAGVAFGLLVDAFAETNEELTARYDADERARAQGRPPTDDGAGRAHLWMQRQDLAGYVLLGDPAARVPVVDQAARRQAARAAAQPTPPASDKDASSAWSSVLGFAAPEQGPPAAQSTTPSAGLPLPLETLEEAIGHVLIGERGIKPIARDYGIDAAELRALTDRYRTGGRDALEP